MGGDPEGTRLAFPVAHKVTVEAFPAALDHFFAAWAAEGRPGEPFGDFAARVGAERLRPALATEEKA